MQQGIWIPQSRPQSLPPIGPNHDKCNVVNHPISQPFGAAKCIIPTKKRSIFRRIANKELTSIVDGSWHWVFQTIHIASK
jgi:hypothetical protein